MEGLADSREQYLDDGDDDNPKQVPVLCYLFRGVLRCVNAEEGCNSECNSGLSSFISAASPNVGIHLWDVNTMASVRQCYATQQNF